MWKGINSETWTRAYHWSNQSPGHHTLGEICEKAEKPEAALRYQEPGLAKALFIITEALPGTLHTHQGAKPNPPLSQGLRDSAVGALCRTHMASMIATATGAAVD